MKQKITGQETTHVLCEGKYHCTSDLMFYSGQSYKALYDRNLRL